VHRMWVVTRFLRENDLLARPLAASFDEIDDDYCIRASDLTAEGLDLVKAAYDRWLKKIDRGGNPEDTSILEKALKKIRDD